MGFCNIRRSVVYVLLMAVLSNARHLLIPNSSSAVSVDTDCPVERLESRLSIIEDQLNRMQRINNPFIKDNCTVDLAAYGLEDSPRCGYVVTSGGSSTQILLSNAAANRGVTLFELDPTTCTTRNRQRFDTYGSAHDRIQFLETLESAKVGTIVVGVSADAAESGTVFQNSTGSFFTKYNMNITGLQLREKFAFMMEKGYPKKTIFQRKPRYGECLRMKVALRGNTVFDVTFSRV